MPRKPADKPVRLKSPTPEPFPPRELIIPPITDPVVLARLTALEEDLAIIKSAINGILEKLGVVPSNIEPDALLYGIPVVYSPDLAKKGTAAAASAVRSTIAKMAPGLSSDQVVAELENRGLIKRIAKK